MNQRRPTGNDSNSLGEIPDLVPDLAPPPAKPPPRHQTAAEQAPAPVALPPIEDPSKPAAASEPPPPIDFGGAIDLDMPGKKGPPPGPGPASNPGASTTPQMQGYKSPAQQVAAELAARGPLGSPDAPAPEAYPGASAAPSVALDLSTSPDPIKAPKDQLQDAARKAAEIGRVVGREVAAQSRVVADKTRDAAMAVAIASIGGAEPKKVIRIEDPSTWVKPMIGPLVAFGLALLLTVIAVAAGVSALRWVSILLLLGAIVFGVIRWIRLQDEG